jgi:Ca-activated chloride channel family protein
MSEPLPENPDRDELRDRLLDRALREIVGGETPPDFSNQILTKAKGHDVPVLTAAGGSEKAMHTNGTRRISGKGWLTMAVAAVLLIGAGVLLYPPIRGPQEAAHLDPKLGQTNRIAARTEQREAVGKRVTTSAGESINVNAAGATAIDSKGKPSDFDSVVDTLQSTVQDETLGEGVAAEAAGKPNRSFAVSQSEGQNGQTSGGLAGATGGTNLRLMVTPKMVRQAEEAADLDVRGGYSPASAPASNVGLHGAINDSYSATSGGATIAAVESKEGAPVATPAGQDGSAFYAGRAVAPESRRKELTELKDLAKQGEHRFGFDHNYVDVEGRGPGLSGDKYARIVENPFKAVSAATTDNRLSTFSIDVDTASYANVREFLMRSRTLPPPDAVRIEELVNYFDYEYSVPTGDVPFAANVEVAGCPWAPEHRLARVGIKGREMERTKRPQSNLVFLIDVSGSMDEPNKLPLLLEGMRLLTHELGENDRVAIVVYASSEGLALGSTPGTDQSTILAALDQLHAGGSTAGGAGIQLAYQVAADNFIKGGVNRVILCTDGDFNVGVTSPAELERMAETKAKETGVFLTVLGFGRGNLNDAMMEQIADKGNGNYHYVDALSEARKVLVEEMAGTLVTIAKDVKIQIEFNPAKVAGYRLIGYENRVLAAEDFNDDKKDAGEIGAGHTVTALYEIVPAGQPVAAVNVDELKYGTANANLDGVTAIDDDDVQQKPTSDELLTLKIRYKQPDGDTSTKLEFPITDGGQSFAKATDDFKFASSVASFGMLLRDSQFKGNATYAGVAEISEAAKSRDPHGYRKEFVEMVRRAQELSGE